MIFRLRDREKFLLAKIDKALARIETGGFGVCEAVRGGDLGEAPRGAAGHARSASAGKSRSRRRSPSASRVGPSRVAAGPSARPRAFSGVTSGSPCTAAPR